MDRVLNTMSERREPGAITGRDRCHGGDRPTRCGLLGHDLAPQRSGQVAQREEDVTQDWWAPDDAFAARQPLHHVVGDLVDYLSRDDMAQVEHSLSRYLGLLR